MTAIQCSYLTPKATRDQVAALYISVWSMLSNCSHENRFKLSSGKQCCNECWRAYGIALKAANKERTRLMRNSGVSYWRSRDIAVGAPVYSQGFTVLGTVSTVAGTAKTGTCGAYVASKRQPGKQLDPRYWHASAPWETSH